VNSAVTAGDIHGNYYSHSKERSDPGESLLRCHVSGGQDTTASDPPEPAVSQGAPETVDAKLQKDVQNPVASLILVPLQNNTNFGSGPFNRTQNVLDIQPVIPINISSYWKVIVRIVKPLVWQPYP
jgi:hypothetical protein